MKESMSKVNIYLDIDGVIKNAASPQKDIEELLRYCSTEFSGSVYWLTTHCRGEGNDIRHALSGEIPKDLLELVLKTIKPVHWNILKTEGIGFNLPFVWLDDTVLPSEMAVLDSHNIQEGGLLLMNPSDPEAAKDALSFIKTVSCTIIEHSEGAEGTYNQNGKR